MVLCETTRPVPQTLGALMYITLAATSAASSPIIPWVKFITGASLLTIAGLLSWLHQKRRITCGLRAALFVLALSVIGLVILMWGCIELTLEPQKPHQVP